jgi:hypothetical protein
VAGRLEEAGEAVVDLMEWGVGGREGCERMEEREGVEGVGRGWCGEGGKGVVVLLRTCWN